MPIPIACPACAARLNAPDAAAGKKLRCPKCRAAVPVPVPEPAHAEFEVVDEPVPMARLRPERRTDDGDTRPRPRPAHAADDADDPPRQPKEATGARPAAARGQLPWVGAAVAGVALMLAACCTIVYFAWPRPYATAGTGGTKPAPGTAPADKAKDELKPLAHRATFRAVGNENGSLFLSADGGRLATGTYTNQIQVWDLGAEPKKVRDHTGDLKAFAPDGKRFVRVGANLDPEVVDADTGAVVSVLKDHATHYGFRAPGVVVGVRAGDAGSKAGKYVVRDYIATTGRPVGPEFEVAGPPSPTVLGPINQGRELVFAWPKEQRVEVWDLTTRQKARGFTLPNSKPDKGWTEFEVSPDGKWVSARRDAGTELFDGQTGAAAGTVPKESQLGNGLFVPHRDVYLKRTYLQDPKTRAFRYEYLVYDIRAKALTATLHQTGDGHGLACSADGKVLAVKGETGTVRLWDLSQLPGPDTATAGR